MEYAGSAPRPRIQKGTRVRNIELRLFGKASSPLRPGDEYVEVLVHERTGKRTAGTIAHRWPIEHVEVVRNR